MECIVHLGVTGWRREGKAFEDSFARWTANFVAICATDFRVDLFSCAAVGPAVRLEDSDVFREERVRSGRVYEGGLDEWPEIR